MAGREASSRQRCCRSRHLFRIAPKKPRLLDRRTTIAHLLDHYPERGRTALNLRSRLRPEEESDMSDPKMTMEVPPQVRDFAIKSVNQAERAISSFMESASKSVAVVPSPMNDAAQQALEITEKNLKAAFEHARKLMNAKDINEV